MSLRAYGPQATHADKRAAAHACRSARQRPLLIIAAATEATEAAEAAARGAARPPPRRSFPTMRSLSRFWAPGGVALVGDAAHTVTPALGQVRRRRDGQGVV
jgi:2-polyprenyl-6-methoxyphenol hydroxylase-like FAD-dependent oxidoreductase